MPPTSIVLVLALAACGGEGGGEGTDTEATDATTSSSTSPTATTTDAPPCTAGQEGCACAAGACEVGLECWSDVCVMPAADTSSDAESTSTTAVDPSTTTDETADDESTSSESSSDDGDASSTTEPALPCLEGNNICQNGMLETCVDGEVQVASCVEQCNLIGYDSPGCDDVNSCVCVGFADETCIEIATAACECYATQDPSYQCVGEDDLDFWYESCVDEDENDHEIITCLGEGALEGLCMEALNVCFQ